MKLKSITPILILIFLFITSCGYAPLNKNIGSQKFIISEKIFSGDKRINRKIFTKLNIEQSNNSDLKLKLDTDLQIYELAKDQSGNVTTYKTTIRTNVMLLKNQEILKNKDFEKSFTYANLANKFELSKYQKEVENNIISALMRELKIFLEY
tara:strand:- start:16 stop:471 length:456 start_codon:yes stop_codon:yes gene_type:complete